MSKFTERRRQYPGWLIVLLICLGGNSIAQTSLVDLSGVDGLDITPDNILNYTVQYTGTSSTEMLIKGVIHYRGSDLRIEYSFRTSLQPGINTFNNDKVFPQFQFSSPALRELFMVHKVLPFGTYQYCVTVIANGGGDGGTTGGEDCLYRRSEDQFMISLVDPENDAKIYEYNPVLTWIATYSFSDALTYKLRVAEIKEGQTTASAITRNNPVYAEKGLTQNSLVYPVYAKPLKAHQPYAWTVDAYYKGILLGGAEPWKFTIIEDSLNQALPDQSSYVDINIDEGSNRYSAVGNIKLKYSENDFLQNELRIKFIRNGKEVNKAGLIWHVKRGSNFTTYDLTDYNLKHKGEFDVIIEFKKDKSNRNKQTIKYKYVDPNLVR